MPWNKILILFALIPAFGAAQDKDSLAVVNTKGLRTVVVAGSVTYATSLVLLNEMWYKNSERQSFRFFNDNAEWKQMDKLGHFYASFHISSGVSKTLQHYGIAESKSDVIGALSGFAVLVPIELFDGHSTAYGASVGDLVADAAGPALYLVQKRLWNEIRIHPKFSFRESPFAQQRPAVLGRGAEQIIKDYNGQTHWLSADLDKFFNFPKWLNLAIGYGADGMIYARDHQHDAAGLDRPFRQYYVSIDFDLSSIRSKSRFINTLLFVANMIKLPSPTIGFSSKGTTFYPAFF